MPAPADVVLRLRVRNHPGVMSHVCGLFARRAFNVEGIVCLPVDDGAESAVLLLVHDDDRLEQMIRQLAKLEDVRSIVRTAEAAAAFSAAAALLSTEGPSAVLSTERPSAALLMTTDQSSQPRNGPT